MTSNGLATVESVMELDITTIQAHETNRADVNRVRAWRITLVHAAAVIRSFGW